MLQAEEDEDGTDKEEGEEEKEGVVAVGVEEGRSAAARRRAMPRTIASAPAASPRKPLTPTDSVSRRNEAARDPGGHGGTLMLSS